MANFIKKLCTDSDGTIHRPWPGSVAEGNAAQVLRDAAKGADLLVVGSRGHGEFVGALLGSVSQQCVHHAPCPVVVIRGDAQARPAHLTVGAAGSARRGRTPGGGQSPSKSELAL